MNRTIRKDVVFGKKKIWLEKTEYKKYLDLIDEVEKSEMPIEYPEKLKHIKTILESGDELSEEDVFYLHRGEKLFAKQIQAKQYNDLREQSPEYKKNWNKYGVIQFKNERIAILQRSWGSQVEFIVAYDDLTKEGYRLMAIDEGKEGGQASGGFTGGVNAYFYFQKMEFVR